MHAPRTGWWPLRLRRCRCGLPWPCQDAGLEAVRDHYGRADNIGAWEAQRDPGTDEADAPPTTRREPGPNELAGPPTTRRERGANEAAGPPTTRREKRDNGGGR